MSLLDMPCTNTRSDLFQAAEEAAARQAQPAYSFSPAAVHSPGSGDGGEAAVVTTFVSPTASGGGAQVGWPLGTVYGTFLSCPAFSSHI